MAVRPERNWETSRLLAKPATVADSQVMFDEYASDPQVAKYMTWTPHRCAADTADFLNRCERAWSDGSAYPWGLWRKRRSVRRTTRDPCDAGCRGSWLRARAPLVAARSHD